MAFAAHVSENFPQEEAFPAAQQLPVQNTNPAVRKTGSGVRGDVEREEKQMRTIRVTGPNLNADMEDFCALYFENEKRSGGGDLEEDGGITWHTEQQCFFITFMDTHGGWCVLAW
jgi:hypothetical protein